MASALIALFSGKATGYWNNKITSESLNDACEIAKALSQALFNDQKPAKNLNPLDLNSHSLSFQKAIHSNTT